MDYANVLILLWKLLDFGELIYCSQFVRIIFPHMPYRVFVTAPGPVGSLHQLYSRVIPVLYLVALIL
jgi:hypothetical protein